MQQSLFVDAARTILDDARGSISYIPDAIAPDLAAAWFAALRDRIAWKSERRMMYEREVDVPRLLSSYWLDDPALPPELAAAAAVAGQLAAYRFNSVGLNFYRDGNDSVAPHNDKLHELVAGAPIALLSLGAVRRMTIRSKEPPRSVVHLDLEPGSLLLMSYATQEHFDHGIPKVRREVGPRISLAFRHRPAKAASY